MDLGSTPFPRVAVVIPAFNAQATLASSIDSIQNQSLSNIVILIVDDGSTDDTADILRGISKADARVIVIRQENAGIVNALNNGIRATNTEIIARHDADDLAEPNRLERQLAFLDRAPGTVAVSSFARHIDADGAETGSTARFLPPMLADPRRIPSREPYLLHPFLMMRREAWNRVGGYRHVLHAEDTDLYWRLSELGELHVMPEALGAYRLNPDSITSSSSVNGRLSALFSQLAAISAKRRADGFPDLDFTPELAFKLKEERTSEGLLNGLIPLLNPEEHLYISKAYSAKMLELTSYRPYELSREDCWLIADKLDRDRITLTAENARDLNRLRAIAVARLARRAHWQEALLLVNRSILVESALRFFSQSLARLLPAQVRRFVRRKRGEKIDRDLLKIY